MTTGVRVPRMNSIMERWAGTCRRELLDRTLIWNHAHLLHALREFESFYNDHRPQPHPAQCGAPEPTAASDHRHGATRPPRHPPTRPTRRHPGTNTPPDLHGWGFRHLHLRHNVASLLLATGMPFASVMKITGHDEDTLKKIYHHVVGEIVTPEIQAAYDWMEALQASEQAKTTARIAEQGDSGATVTSIQRRRTAAS